MIDRDLVVVGGGPAGATTALLLARAGLRVALILGPPAPAAGIGESLAPAVTPLLHRLGLYDRFLKTRPAPCHANRSAWGGEGALTEHDFLSDPHGPGWHIDRPAFDAMLVQAAVEAGAMLLRAPAGPSPTDAFVASSADRSRRGCDAGREPNHLAKHTFLLPLAQHWERGPGGEGQPGGEGPAVIDATGRAAAVARRMGARHVWADRMVAIVGFLIAAREPMADTATLVEAVPDGWWYSAPLPDGRMIAAFHTDPSLPAARAACMADGWWALLAAAGHTSARVARYRYEPAAKPRLVSAGTAILQPMAGAGWLAVGDAAVQHDPLGSHGIAAALHSAVRAAATVQAYRAGDTTALDCYAAERQAAHAHFLQVRAAYYRDVARWPDAPFWRARRNPGGATGARVPQES